MGILSLGQSANEESKTQPHFFFFYTEEGEMQKVALPGHYFDCRGERSILLVCAIEEAGNFCACSFPICCSHSLEPLPKGVSSAPFFLLICTSLVRAVRTPMIFSECLTDRCICTNICFSFRVFIYIYTYHFSVLLSFDRSSLDISVFFFNTCSTCMLHALPEFLLFFVFSYNL